MKHEFDPTPKLLRCAWAISALLATLAVITFIESLASRHAGQAHFASGPPAMAAHLALDPGTARGPLATAEGVSGFPANAPTPDKNGVFAHDRER